MASNIAVAGPSGLSSLSSHFLSSLALETECGGVLEPAGGQDAVYESGGCARLVVSTRTLKDVK